MTPTFTKLERQALKLLIKLAWQRDAAADWQAARALVIKALELDDERPVDVERRKETLNAFLATPDPLT
jgi:hypothetical protein